jgi:hypothetical protein
MKIQIYSMRAPEPYPLLGEIEVEPGQFRYDPSPGNRGVRRGEITGLSCFRLQDMLGVGFGEHPFRMVFGSEVLNGCKITRSGGQRLGFLFFDTPPVDQTFVAVPV